MSAPFAPTAAVGGGLDGNERPQVAVGTHVDHGGALRTTWADCELSYGELHVSGGVWRLSPATFARRYRDGLARMVRHVGTVTDPAVEDLLAAAEVAS